MSADDPDDDTPPPEEAVAPPPLPPVPMPGTEAEPLPPTLEDGDEEPSREPAAVEPLAEPIAEPIAEPDADPLTLTPTPEPLTEPDAEPAIAEAPVAKAKRRLRWGRALLILLAFLILGPPVSVLALKIIPPPVTILMLERLAQGQGLDKHWRPLDRIAPSLATAVIAAEDAKFCEHDGFDWDAIQEAAEKNARGGKVRGGSTISQQTAKNVFLWPARDYLRKGLEAGYTVLIEKIWGKRRILEAYLNVVEWGPGLYGAQAAAQRYFHEDADRLTPAQSARLAAILPSPLKWKAVNPGKYVARRSRRIGANAAIVREDDLAWCVRR